MIKYIILYIEPGFNINDLLLLIFIQKARIPTKQELIEEKNIYKCRGDGKEIFPATKQEIEKELENYL